MAFLFIFPLKGPYVSLILSWCRSCRSDLILEVKNGRKTFFFFSPSPNCERRKKKKSSLPHLAPMLCKSSSFRQLDEESSPEHFPLCLIVLSPLERYPKFQRCGGQVGQWGWKQALPGGQEPQVQMFVLLPLSCFPNLSLVMLLGGNPAQEPSGRCLLK